MAILEYDKETAQRLLAVYTTPDVEQQRREFLNAINLEVGERVLDVGSGPGFLTRAIAEKVGAQGVVRGVDISEFLIEVAKSYNEDQATISFSYGDASNLDFANEEFDTVVCTQVLEYVQDVDAALKEFNRVLKKGGKVALLDTDWDSIVPFVLEHCDVLQEELDSWSAELRNENDQEAYFFSLNRYFFLGTKTFTV